MITVDHQNASNQTNLHESPCTPSIFHAHHDSHMMPWTPYINHGCKQLGRSNTMQRETSRTDDSEENFFSFSSKNARARGGRVTGLIESRLIQFTKLMVRPTDHGFNSNNAFLRSIYKMKQLLDLLDALVLLLAGDFSWKLLAISKHTKLLFLYF